MPPRRTGKVIGIEKTPGHRFKCPSFRCHCSFVKYEKLEKHLQNIYLTIVQGIRHSQNAIQIQHDYDNNTFSFKSNICKQLDEINNKLKIAKEKYLPLTENRHPHFDEFGQCQNSISLLKVEISGFNEKQIRQINSILVNKVAAERENDVLMRRNLEFFEEAEVTKTRNHKLENNLHLLKQQNVELSKEIEELPNKEATLSEVVYIID
ncbi:26388_t:CDS:2 [Gigaspora margarita]|uniref:26388_t:CDS:1 n=1 Tax=Gigaspora margarita TaxID=4874 RepID=A0ABM8W5Y9_GIGMA|nr:26388_t:CDS:2 [Gigaspora margarita]